jgi:acyl-CoA synthetase (AMP-forming)/AMP-acid ligase II
VSAIARALSHALGARGLRRGDRVLWVVRSSIDAVLVLLGALRGGFIVVPVNAGYQQAELSHVLADSGAALVVVDGAHDVVDAVAGSIPVVSCAALLAEARDRVEAGHDLHDPDLHDVDYSGRDDDDDALILYTSGTTGRAKGCVHTWRSLTAGLDALMQAWQIGPGDVVVHALPLFHVHGLCVALLGALAAGASVRLLPRFTPDGVIDAVAAGGTVFMAVPTMVHRMLHHLDEHPDEAAMLARLRLFTCGSAPLSAAQLTSMRERTGLTILERYGMTETLITLSNPLQGERRAGAVGWPLPGISVRIVDDELQVRADSLMRGYWNRPDADREVFLDDPEGGLRWFRTGDVVTADDDGYVHIVGRASQDILKVGGYKISAREIEEQLSLHDDVAEVAVVGLPDDEWGERVCAVVVAKAGRAPSLGTLQDSVRLQEAKKPRALVLVDALPRNGMGKVQKTEVKALAVRLLSSSSSS